MYTYTNRKGELIEVSEQHLRTAVDLKVLLQKDSNSYRCSWAKHRKMMIKEGFDDSDVNESYRQLIIRYQRSIGELPSSDTFADKVVTSKLESYKELVGESIFHKREAQKYLRQINKGKREIVDGTLFIEEMRQAVHNVLSNVKWDEVLNHTFEPIFKHSKSRMILCLTDWHIGAMVDVEDNKYNYEIAKRRIEQTVQEAIRMAKERRVYRVDVVYMGDILEHAYMREAQAYDAEFPVTTQMTLGGRLIVQALYQLSRNFFTTYRGFAGNHDRMNKDKNANISGDTGMVVVNEIVKVFVETANIENLMYVDTHAYNAKLVNVNGRNFKFVHGDLEKKDDKKKIADHGSRDKIHYDAIVYGHFHHYMVLEVGLDRFEIRVGSTKGSDDYSEKLGVGSAPSQAVIFVDSDGLIEPVRIRLN
jgi:predicted phosphodiesterase